MWWTARCQKRHLVLFRSSCEHRIRYYFRQASENYQTTKPKPRLRVLFCGSDYFSIASLKALHAYAKSPGSNILSIDVATKTDKRAGRGLQIIRPPSIKPVAQELCLPVHQFDTFTGWQLPHYESDDDASINLIIAVSFGLLVPARILRACRYGGINVHPSLLPDLKGPAPIQHAILNGYTQTGLTIQTLHPSKYDEGDIIDQTTAPGISIPRPDSITAVELERFLAPIGADMLVKTIRTGSYLPGYKPLQPDKISSLNTAPKMLPENRQIIFSHHSLALSVERILRMNRAIPKLWVEMKPLVTQAPVRLILSPTLRSARDYDFQDQKDVVLYHTKIGTAFAIIHKSESIKNSRAPLLIRARNGFIAVPNLTVSGSKEGPGAASAARAFLFQDPIDVGDYQLYLFRNSLP